MEDNQQQKDEQYMRKALAEAEAAFESGEIPIGAVVVCKDRIISRGHNLTETHGARRDAGYNVGRGISWGQIP